MQKNTKDKKKDIIATLKVKHNLHKVSVKRTGEHYVVLIEDIILHSSVAPIEKSLQILAGNYTDPKFNWLKAWDLRCSNVRFG